VRVSRDFIRELAESFRLSLHQAVCVESAKTGEMLGHELTGAEAEALYKDRSAFVHGSPVSFIDFSDELREIQPL
jgi:hypothetical protein